MLQVTGVQTTIERLPVSPPVKTAIHDIRSIDTVVVQVSTNRPGVKGQSYLFAFGLERARALEALVHDLAGVIRGANPLEVRHLWQRMWESINFLGHKGAAVMALSGIDVALWDLRGKYFDAPVFRLLGGADAPLPVYASGGLWLSYTEEELRADLDDFLARGYRAVKLRIGSPEVATDVRRTRMVREYIGPDCKLLVDANQGWGRAQALAYAEAVRDCDLYWFEEPFPFDDRDSYRWLAQRTSIPLAAGETEYSRFGARDWLGTGISVFMPDLERIGGVTEWLRVADLLGAHGLAVSPHLFLEYSVHLMAAVPGGPILEDMHSRTSDWTDGLFEDPITIEDGCVVPPERPGFWLTLKRSSQDRLDSQL